MALRWQSFAKYCFGQYDDIHTFIYITFPHQLGAYLFSYKIENTGHTHTPIYTQIDVICDVWGRRICFQLFFSSYLIREYGMKQYYQQKQKKTLPIYFMFVNFSELICPHKRFSFRSWLVFFIVEDNKIDWFRYSDLKKECKIQMLKIHKNAF